MQKESEATFDDGFALVSRSSRTLELQRFVPPRSVELRIAKSLARHGEIRSMVRDHDILQTPPLPHYSLGPLTQSAVDVPQVLDRLHGDLLSIERRTQKYTPRHHKPSVRSSAPELSSPTKSGVVEVVRLQTRKKCPWSNVTLGSVACCIAGQPERQTLRLRPPQQLRSTTTSRCGVTVGCVCVRVERADNSCRLRPGWCSWADRREEQSSTLYHRWLSAAPAAASGARLGALQRCANGCRCPYRLPLLQQRGAPFLFAQEGIAQPRAASVHERRGSSVPKSSPERGDGQTQLFSLHVPTVLCTLSVQPSPVPCRYCYIPHKRKNKPR